MQPPDAFTNLWPHGISEDCLTLNVYRPHNANASRASAVEPSSADTAALPVMLFFYGGSYVEGTSSFIIYEASEWVSHAAASPDPVIVVTANYRLNAFGYLGADALRDVTARNATGNYGLEDQRAAMRWVRDNARAFGGDPARVTIFGESAGAGSVSMHLVAPRSKGLFSGAIAQSGPLAARWVYQRWDEAAALFADLVRGLGCGGPSNAADVAQCLRGKDAVSVLAATAAAAANHSGHAGGVVKMAPTVDGVEFDAAPMALVARGAWNRVPLVLGTNLNEGTILVSPFPQNATAAQYGAWVRATMAAAYGARNGSAVADAVLQKYYPVADFATPFAAAAEVFTDFAMSCPARATARALSGGSNGSSDPAIFLYHFVHAPALVKLLEPALGCFHGSELAFVFDKRITLLGGAERALAAQFSALWSGFAARRAPTAAGDGVQWPRYATSSDLSLRIDAGSARAANLTVVRGLKKRRCDWWASLGPAPSVKAAVV